MDRKELIERLRDYPFDKIKKQAADMLEADGKAVPQEPVATMKCIGGDHLCPCQDGDACHYKDCGDGTKALPIPEVPQELVAKRSDRTTQEFMFGMRVLNWNRAQQDPPIDIGRELWTADEIMKLATPQPQPAAPQEPVSQQHWGTTYRAVCAAVEACKQAGGMHLSIDRYVNKTQITHDALGTDTAPQPQRPRLTDAEIDAIPFNGFTNLRQRFESENECLRSFARAIERKVRGER